MFGSSISKVKALCVGAVLVAQGSVAFAGGTTISSVQAQLNRIKGGGSSSFCYVVEGGAVQGINADKPVRIASVMKLMTSFWAIEKLGSPNFRWKTKIYYQASNGEMHIEGSRDPFFHRDRMYLLLSDLNRAGIKSLNRLTVDRNFKMGMAIPDVSNHLNESSRNTSQTNVTRDDLMQNFNTAKWWGDRKATYARIRKENQTPELLKEISFKVNAADIVPSNPLAGKPGVKVFEIRSAPLRYYLKRMNIMSANPMADELFYSLGGVSGFANFLQSNYGMGNAATDVHSGSGLPIGPPRNDSSMSCSAVVRIIRRMDLDLEKKHGMDLADVVMVAGIDTADSPTFKDGSKSLVVKTGTLTAGDARAKNLAGSMQTTSGEVYFGIFMQGAAAGSGPRQSILNAFMSKFSRKAVNRKTFHFDALDNEMRLRPQGAPAPAASPVQEVQEIVVTARRPAKPAAKPVVLKTAARKPVAAAKPAARKPVAKALTPREKWLAKVAARKAAAAKPAPRKAVASKPAARKPVASKPAARKPVAHKPAARKPVAKAAPKKAAARKIASRK
ncbi:MAG: hypothetical protein EOP05_01400 [Proteobacteria bacterium]|nr:MAG: hypothetical protein EOP05_01400 [Pseudomonadota bacterium]